MRKKNHLVSIVLVTLFALTMVACGGKNNSTTLGVGESAAGPASSTTAPSTSSATGLPIVDNPAGVDPSNPMSGADSNADSRAHPVRDGQVVKNWTELDALLGGDQSYKDCASQEVPNFDWVPDVDKFKASESSGTEPRFLLAQNTALSDDQVRAKASADMKEDLTGLQILRVDAIVNTTGFTNGGCAEFEDHRSIVRVSLGVIVYNDDGTVKGVQNDGGVFVDCHNPWHLIPPTPPAPPTDSTPPMNSTPPPTGGTPPCSVGCTTPTTRKPAQTDNCMLNGIGCTSPNGAVQPVQDNSTSGVNTGPTPGAPTSEPPPADRPSGDPHGGSGDGGTGPATGPKDDGHKDDSTPAPSTPPCPFGPGNC